MAITDRPLTIENVEAEIAFVDSECKKRLRHLRALKRCLEDEAAGQQRLFPELENGTKPATTAK